MPEIKLATNFFQKERDQAYSNPPLAVWRELFQNSIDQDVTQIDVTLSDDLTTSSGGQYVLLTFADNGPGMTAAVRDDVYFNLGNSTKDNDPTKIGGMGRARILTCFAMQSYRLLSQDYEVVGHGGHYEVSPHAYTDGCKLIIEVDGYTHATMQEELDRFLLESRISARLNVNGQRVANRSVNPGRHVRDLEANGQIFAKVWVNKSAKSGNRVIVRVNGVSMFTNHTDANAQVVVELEAAISRKVLTANRDGLHSGYRRAMEQFLSELTVDTSSALRSRFGRRTTVARGGGMQTVRQPVRKVAATPRDAVSQEMVLLDASLRASFEQPPRQIVPVHADDSFVEIDTFNTWLSRTFGDIYLFDETEEPLIRKALPAYNPTGWKVHYKNTRGATRPYLKGGTIIRLLLMWHTAISYAIEVSLKALGKTEVPFAVGFVFAENKAADHRSQDNGHVFSLCPVNSTGNLDFAIANRRDLKRLMTLAKHETAHINVSWHSETFSSLREAIDIEFDDEECLRRMNDVLRLAGKEGLLYGLN